MTNFLNGKVVSLFHCLTVNLKLKAIVGSSGYWYSGLVLIFVSSNKKRLCKLRNGPSFAMLW